MEKSIDVLSPQVVEEITEPQFFGGSAQAIGLVPRETQPSTNRAKDRALPNAASRCRSCGEGPNHFPGAQL